MPSGTLIGLWQISESATELLKQYPYLEKYECEIAERFRSEARQREYLAVRALLHSMTNDDQASIRYLQDGCPYLDHWNCSISHTKGYAVLMLSADMNVHVAIDIEYFSNRVGKIANKFIASDEPSESIQQQLIIWSAKETMYKLFHEGNLDYFDMKVMPFEVKTSGIISVVNLKRHHKYSLNYLLNDAFVLTYADISDNEI